MNSARPALLDSGRRWFQCLTMSKSSSSSDPVEFQFELDIGEDVPSPATEPPEKTEPEAQVDDPGDYVILKRKARKGKPKKLDPGKAQTDKGQTSSGRE